jgi:hypothetical protein
VGLGGPWSAMTSHRFHFRPQHSSIPFRDYSFSKQLSDISGTVKHRDHFDAILNTTIKDEATFLSFSYASKLTAVITNNTGISSIQHPVSSITPSNDSP